MDVERIGDEASGAYVIRNTEAGEPEFLAEMTFEFDPTGKVMTILHTGVGDTLQGQGIGRKLVESAIENARFQGFKIMPRCSYAARIFEKAGDELADVHAEAP